MLQLVVHYSLHFLFPGLVAYIFFRKRWQYAWLLMLLTMAIDFDHLFANPIFDSNRCSIGFHPLHGYLATALYFLLLIPKKTRIIGLGLLLHIATDGLDCVWMR